MTHLELLFREFVAPGDVEILTPASADQPGLARLLAAKVEAAGEHGSRVLSSNGGALIGILATDDPWWPYETTYWIQGDDSNDILPRHYAGGFR